MDLFILDSSVSSKLFFLVVQRGSSLIDPELLQEKTGILSDNLRCLTEGSPGTRQATEVLHTCVSGANICGVKITIAQLFSVIWVARFSIYTTIIPDIIKRNIHPSSIASLVASAAIDQILFAERHKIASLFKVLTFQRASTAKRPARTTLL